MEMSNNVTENDIIINFLLENNSSQEPKRNTKSVVTSSRSASGREKKEKKLNYEKRSREKLVGKTHIEHQHIISRRWEWNVVETAETFVA